MSAVVLKFPEPKWEFQPSGYLRDAAATARLIGEAGPNAALVLVMGLLDIATAKDKARLAKRLDRDCNPSEGERGDAIRQAQAIVRYSLMDPQEKAVIFACTSALAHGIDWS